MLVLNISWQNFILISTYTSVCELRLTQLIYLWMYAPKQWLYMYCMPYNAWLCLTTYIFSRTGVLVLSDFLIVSIAQTGGYWPGSWDLPQRGNLVFYFLKNRVRIKSDTLQFDSNNLNSRRYSNTGHPTSPAVIRNCVVACAVLV